MAGVWEIAVLLLLVGGIVLLLAPRMRGRRGPGGLGGQLAHGTLLVTGVSAGPESDGSQFVTITGVINGPTVREQEVYARMTMQVGTSPTMGQLMPIVYSPKNPEKWGFAPSQPPEAPGPAGPTELR
ncbi:hypothetical protein TUM20985_42370 [Mycobacterium antarcticum]|nr:hypothetical protein TUM20985_42370 [Mycolicibacterium sp. TUM20985]GLP76858.1 hypothetical protein TUM20983_39680 [Mycolicibacterium sp. TUM20983]